MTLREIQDASKLNVDFEVKLYDSDDEKYNLGGNKSSGDTKFECAIL